MTRTVSGLAPLRGQTTQPRKSRSSVWPPIVLGAAAIVAWAVAAHVSHSTVFPGPGEAVSSLIDDLHRPRYRESILLSMRVLLVAYLAAVTVGSLLGMLLGLSAFWSRVLLPLVYALNSIPKITLYPLFLLFLGIGDVSRGTFAFASGVLPVFLMVTEGTAAVSRQHLKMAASNGVGRARLIRQIVVPSVLPVLAAAMKLAFGLTFLGLLLAEIFSADAGLGFEIERNVTLVRMDHILGEVLLIGFLALVPTLLLQALEARIRARFGAADH